MWRVYIVQCNDGSYYTGITVDLEERLNRHNEGRGSLYTKQRRPVQLKYLEKFETREKARNREIEIKDFSIKNKEKLILRGRGERFPSARII